MPRYKKQPNLLTRLFHAAVGFLALSSTIRAASRNEEENNHILSPSSQDRVNEFPYFGTTEPGFEHDFYPEGDLQNVEVVQIIPSWDNQVVFRFNSDQTLQLSESDLYGVANEVGQHIAEKIMDFSIYRNPTQHAIYDSKVFSFGSNLRASLDLYLNSYAELYFLTVLERNKIAVKKSRGVDLSFNQDIQRLQLNIDAFENALNSAHESETDFARQALGNAKKILGQTVKDAMRNHRLKKSKKDDAVERELFESKSKTLTAYIPGVDTWEKLEKAIEANEDVLSLTDLINIGNSLLTYHGHFDDVDPELALKLFLIAHKKMKIEASKGSIELDSLGEAANISYGRREVEAIDQTTLYLWVMNIGQTWKNELVGNPFKAQFESSKHASKSYIEGTGSLFKMISEYFSHARVYYYNQEQLILNRDNPDFDPAKFEHGMNYAKTNMNLFKEKVRRRSDAAQTKRFMIMLKQADLLFRAHYYHQSESMLRHEKAEDKFWLINGGPKAKKIYGGKRSALQRQFRTLSHLLDVEVINENVYSIQEEFLNGKKEILEKEMEYLWLIYLLSFKFGLLVMVSLLFAHIQQKPELKAGLIKLLYPFFKKPPLKTEQRIEEAQPRIKKEKKPKADRGDIPEDPEQVKQREKELKEHLEKQKEERMKRENEQAMKAAEMAKHKAEKLKREKTLESVYHQVFSTLSNLKSDKGSVKNAFAGGNLRNLISDQIKQESESYFIQGSWEVDQCHLAKNILKKIKIDQPLKEDLLKQFTEIYEKGPDVIRAREAQAQAEQARQLQEEAERQAQAAREAAEEQAKRNQESKQRNQRLHQYEMQAKATQNNSKHASSSFSSSQRGPVVGFSNNKEAENMKTLVLHFFDQLKVCVNRAETCEDLFELKHDIILLSSSLEKIVKGGGRDIVYTLMDYSQWCILRNGTLHLLEIKAPEPIQVTFYRSALMRLGQLCALEVNQNTFKDGLNSFLQDFRKHNDPIRFDEHVTHEIYESFQADNQVWKGDHEKKSRSDVRDDLLKRQEMLAQIPADQTRKITMVCAEIGELYHQLKNSGAKLSHEAHVLIEAKNQFSHQGESIEPQFHRRALGLN